MVTRCLFFFLVEAYWCAVKCHFKTMCSTYGVTVPSYLDEDVVWVLWQDSAVGVAESSAAHCGEVSRGVNSGLPNSLPQPVLFRATHIFHKKKRQLSVPN